MNKLKNDFKIILLRPHWIEKGDQKIDQCLHSPVFVQVGDEIVSNENSGDWTVSSTGLYLLRSLSSGYIPGAYASQLLPCCGFSFLAIEGFSNVQILGCPNGIDWTIEIERNIVRHKTENGTTFEMEFERYRKIVISFAKQVEAYYQTSEPKIVREESESKDGVHMFWEEWKTLVEKWV